MPDAVRSIQSIEWWRYRFIEISRKLWSGIITQPSATRVRPSHPAAVRYRPRRTSPNPTIRTGRALATGYTIVKSDAWYALANAYRYVAPHTPEHAARSQQRGVIAGYNISVIRNGMRPRPMMNMSICAMKAISDLCLRARRFHVACMKVDMRTSVMAVAVIVSPLISLSGRILPVKSVNLTFLIRYCKGQGYKA